MHKLKTYTKHQKHSIRDYFSEDSEKGNRKQNFGVLYVNFTVFYSCLTVHVTCFQEKDLLHFWFMQYI